MIQIAVCLSVCPEPGRRHQQTAETGTPLYWDQTGVVFSHSSWTASLFHRKLSVRPQAAILKLLKTQFSCLSFADYTRISSMRLAASGMSMFMREGTASKPAGSAGTEQVWWGWGRGGCSPLATEPAAGMQCAGGGLPLCTGTGCAHSCAGGNLLRRSQVLSAEHMLSNSCPSKAFGHHVYA